jgi:signal transduction histidine kinase
MKPAQFLHSLLNTESDRAGSDGVRDSWLAVLQDQVLRLESQRLDMQPAMLAVAESLVGAGFGPERVSVSILTRHPGLSGLGFVWSRSSQQVAFLERPPGFLDTPEHLVSPLHAVMTTGEALFLDHDALSTDPRFPIVREFVRAGATSYLALPLHTARGDVHVLAMWTAQSGGWKIDDAMQLARLVPMLSLLVEVTENRRLLGIIGTAHELTQRAMAEQALRDADALMRHQALDMERLQAERRARLEIERQLEERSRDLAERNDALKALAASLEEKVSARTVELERALERAHSATLAKSRFLAMMSHEIRTPMHGVLGLAELLARSRLDAEQSRYVATIQTTGESLLSLLNGILDFSKIEANRVEFEAVPLDPARLLEDVVTLMRGTALERGLIVEMRCAEDLPRCVTADPTRLRQIWMNLIGNAIKFTERGRVSMSLEVAQSVGSSVTLRGQVSDTGAGIEAEALNQLFEPFAQGDSSTARRFGGTGLGLAICKGLVEQMGGSIRVDSRVGAGTTFTFEITLALADRNEAPALTDAPPDLADLVGLRVLVVDDNPVNRLVTERQLMMLGMFSPVLAESGMQALALLESARFDVILMDMQMPEMDGLEATRRLRRLGLPRQPHVIGVTANAFAEDREACIAAGMNDFLSKPISLRHLGGALRAGLHDRSG